MSKFFHKIRNVIETIFIYAVGLPIGFAYWITEREMRKLMGDDWITRGEPSGYWDKEQDG